MSVIKKYFPETPGDKMKIEAHLVFYVGIGFGIFESIDSNAVSFNGDINVDIVGLKFKGRLSLNLKIINSERCEYRFSISQDGHPPKTGQGEAGYKDNGNELFVETDYFGRITIKAANNGTYIAVSKNRAADLIGEVYLGPA